MYVESISERVKERVTVYISYVYIKRENKEKNRKENWKSILERRRLNFKLEL